MINTDVYGLAENWTAAQYLPHAKYANFGTAENPKNTLLEGSDANKTPTGELIENSICTQALGNESLYCNMLWVHDYGDTQYVEDTKTFLPFFYAENSSTDGNIQNNTSSINPRNNWNSWQPYLTDTSETYTNMSAYSRPITEYNPNKILYEMDIWFSDEYGEIVGPFRLQRTEQAGEQAVIATHPYVIRASMRPWVDNSSTSTPNRELINSNALFGICINDKFNANYDQIGVDYAVMRSCVYNEIPVYGVFGSSTYFDDYYTCALCAPDDIMINYNIVSARHIWNSDFKEFLIKQAACFGVYLRVDMSDSAPFSSVQLDSNDIICGLLDENGVGHGDYTRGAANRTNPIWNWDTNRDSPFDPYKIPDPTKYDTTTVFTANSLFNTFIKYYALSPSNLTGLCNSINTYISNVDTDVEDINKAITKTFYTNNPLDVIVSLKRFPFNITQYGNITGQASEITLGSLTLSTTLGYKLNGQYTVVDFGSYSCYPVFGNTFLDYAPYTYYELIIPFCGSTRLDPAVFMGRTLRLKMVVDLYTGACTCYILADNLCIDSVSGNCAIDIPITGIQSADFQNSVQNAITNVKNARINTAAYNMKGNMMMSPVWTGQIGSNALFKGGAAARVGNVVSGMSASLSSALNLGGNIASAEKAEADNYTALQKAEYDLQHVQTPYASVGSQSAANSYVEEMQARLIIYRPKFADDYVESIYAATEGFACLINGKVKDFSGLTVGTVKTNNIVNNAGVSPTAAEQSMLRSAFVSGVIL